MHKSILASALILASTSAIAEKGDLWLNLHIGSKHSGEGYYDQTIDWKANGEFNNSSTYREYNETNYGGGLIYEVEDFIDARIGGYQNSVHSTSVYAGGSLHSSFTNPVAVGLMLGAITGYDAITGMPVSIMVMPYASLNTKYARAEITYLPGIGETDSILGLSLAFTF